MATTIGQPLEPSHRQMCMEESQPLTKMTLLKSLLSPTTFPHLILLAIASVVFFIMARMDVQAWAAYGFIGFSLTYVCLAPLSTNERIASVLRYTKNSDQTFAKSLPTRFKILLLPFVFGFLLMLAINLIFGENGLLQQVGSFLPALLGGLFVVWAMAQGRFFGLASMNGIAAPEQGEINSEGFSPVPSLIMTSALVVVMTLAVTEGLRFFLTQGSFSLWPYLFSFAVYSLCIYLTWGQRKQASLHSTTHAVARKWFWTTQLFITWHVLSIFRSIDSASTDTMIFIEELFLMIVTVFLAIWALTSKGEGSESALFTRENALFWGVAFGYAYAGSVAMITSVMENVRLVLIAGHILVVATVMYLQRSMLQTRVHRMNSDRGIVQSVIQLDVQDTPTEDAKPTTKGAEVDAKHSEQEGIESIGDPVDWNQTPESLGDSTTWDDEIELLD